MAAIRCPVAKVAHSAGAIEARSRTSPSDPSRRRNAWVADLGQALGIAADRVGGRRAGSGR